MNTLAQAANPAATESSRARCRAPAATTPFRTAFRFCLRVAVLAWLATQPLTAQIRVLSFYVVHPAGTAPVLDGQLDEAAWQDVPEHSTYYEYAKPDPGPGKLKTSFKMIYDDQGLYLGIVNGEAQMDKIRKNVHTTDDVNLWRDDCAELYFDPDATSIGFTKFTINALGVQGDMRKLDAAVTLGDWSGAGWQAKASLNELDWRIEAFFPWEDLNRKPVAGELWMFVHTRYSWVEGFVGVGSSPGGGYQAPDKFGYLYFAGRDESISSRNIADILTPRAHAPWLLAIGSDLISNLGGRTQVSDLDWEIRLSRGAFSQALLEAKLLSRSDRHKAELAELETQSGDFQTIDLGSHLGLQTLIRQLTEMKWKLLLDQNFN